MNTTAPWVIATRESRLALWQAEHVRDLLRQRSDRPVELLGMTTKGDQILDRSLSKVGGKGLFVKELEVALEEGRAHLAVHSLKDVPMELPEGFVLSTVMAREDPRDALVSPHHASLDALPQGAVVGTSSLRRLVQLKARRPDLRIEPLRGNLDTRLRKLDEGQYDAIILAAAGLTRLGMGERIRSVMPADVSLPAAGQGALGIECLAARTDVIGWLQPLVDADTTACVLAERAVARALAGSCEVPLGAYAVTREGRLWLRGFVARPDGSEIVRAEREGAPADAEALGRALADDLRGQGAEAILADIG